MSWKDRIFGNGRSGGRPLPARMPDDWLAGFEESAAHATALLSPDRLLISLWGPWHSRGDKEASLAIGGGYCGYGETHPEADRWPVYELYLLANPAFRSRWDRLKAAGLKARFASFQEHNLHGFYIVIAINERSLAAIRELAKADAGAVTPEQSRDFDQRFDLYLKQNWIRDDAERDSWREREPLAEWPWAPPNGREHD
jgi:hypothetical protein